MPQGGPRPKQFSQAGATVGDSIVAQPVGSDADRASPAYEPLLRAFYLERGVFGDLSDDELIRADTAFPDLTDDFESYDFIESFDDDQSASVAYQGRLPDGLILSGVRLNIKGDDASLTSPPRYRLRVYMEGAASANPVFDSGELDAPDGISELVIDASTLEQPTGQGRYFITVQALLDTDQILFVSRPFVTES